MSLSDGGGKKEKVNTSSKHLPKSAIFSFLTRIVGKKLENQEKSPTQRVDSTLECDKLTLFKMEDNIKPIKFRLHRKWHFLLPISVSVMSLFVTLAVLAWSMVRLNNLTDRMDNSIRSIPPTQSAISYHRKAPAYETEQSKDTNTNMAAYLELEEMINDLKVKMESLKSTTHYTHWGKSTCQGDTTLVYSGFGAGAASTDTDRTGGGAEYLCLPLIPEWNRFDLLNDSRAHSFIYSVQYTSAKVFDKAVNRMNMVCSVCVAPRSTQVMIPARITCPDSWTKEYTGYLMSSHIADLRSSYICVDEFPQGVNGTETKTAGAGLYPVSGYCGDRGSLQHCPPYVNARELTCVVCSK